MTDLNGFTQLLHGSPQNGGVVCQTAETGIRFRNEDDQDKR